jgi:hypothetical protein
MGNLPEQISPMSLNLVARASALRPVTQSDGWPQLADWTRSSPVFPPLRLPNHFPHRPVETVADLLEHRMPFETV